MFKTAINKSHPPTARYLVETAAACLDHGLQETPQGFIQKPVAWKLIASSVQASYPGVTNLLERLHGNVGQKYFSLLGTTPSGQSELVVPKITDLITSCHRPPVEHLLACLEDALSVKQSALSAKQHNTVQGPTSANSACSLVR